MQKISDAAQLAAVCKSMRRELIQMITEAKSGHPGGSLSATEIVVTLFFDVMNHDPFCRIDRVGSEISKGFGWIVPCRVLHYLNRQMPGRVINEVPKRLVSELLNHCPVGVVGFEGDYSPSPHNRWRRLGPKRLT